MRDAVDGAFEPFSSTRNISRRPAHTRAARPRTRVRGGLNHRTALLPQTPQHDSCLAARRPRGAPHCSYP